MRAALACTVFGALIVFAYHGKTTVYAGLSIRATGWVLFLAGIFFGLLFATPHYHRWRTTVREED